MRLRTRLVAGASVWLIALMPAAAAAQDDAAALAPAYFSGTMSEAATFPEPLEVEVPETVSPGGGHDAVDAVFEGLTVETTDPRMAGVLDMALSSAHRNTGEGFVQASNIEYVLRNDAGAWTGSGLEYIAIADGPQGAQLASLTGTGAYEGLNAIVSVRFVDGQNRWEGIIYAGELPPPSDFDGSADARAAITQE
jgi:hypothetical protein